MATSKRRKSSTDQGQLGDLGTRIEKLQTERDLLIGEVQKILQHTTDLLADLGDDEAAPLSIEYRHVKTRQRKRRTMSPEGRRRIAAAARKRWAEYRAKKAKD